MRELSVLLLALTATPVTADDWGDCRNKLKAAGAVFSTDSSVSGITLTQTLAGLSFEPTAGEEPVVSITFEKGERAVLDEGNTVFMDRWLIVHDLMQVDRNDIGSYFIMEDDKDISLIRAKDGCRRLRILTVWPDVWTNN